MKYGIQQCSWKFIRWKMNLLWSWEDFEDLNPPNRQNGRSRLDVLSDTGAFVEPYVFSAAAELEQRDAPHVVAFFQIPRPIFTGNKRFFIPAREERVIIEYQFTPIRLELDIYGRIQIIVDDESDSFLANATQVTAFVPLWQKRAQHFHKYQNCFATGVFHNNIVIGSEESWINSRPISAEDFEFNMCRRLVRELVFSCRHFLKGYSSVMRENFLTDDWLYGYFLMLTPGRVAFAAPPRSLIAYMVGNHPISQRSVVEWDWVEKAIPHTYRVYSRFERQIFVLRDLVTAGHYALATIGGMSLIEWILRVNAPKEVKQRNLAQLIGYFNERSISPQVSEYLHEIRRLRNIVVHLGEYAHFKGTGIHEVLELDVDSQVGRTEADKTLDLAWSLFQSSNGGRLLSE